MKQQGSIHIKKKIKNLPDKLQWDLAHIVGDEFNFFYMYDDKTNFSNHIKREIRYYEKLGYGLITIKYGRMNVSFYKKGK